MTALQEMTGCDLDDEASVRSAIASLTPPKRQQLLAQGQELKRDLLTKQEHAEERSLYFDEVNRSADQAACQSTRTARSSQRRCVPRKRRKKSPSPPNKPPALAHHSPSSLPLKFPADCRLHEHLQRGDPSPLPVGGARLVAVPDQGRAGGGARSAAASAAPERPRGGRGRALGAQGWGVARGRGGGPAAVCAAQPAAPARAPLPGTLTCARLRREHDLACAETVERARRLLDMLLAYSLQVGWVRDDVHHRATGPRHQRPLGPAGRTSAART